MNESTASLIFVFLGIGLTVVGMWVDPIVILSGVSVAMLNIGLLLWRWMRERGGK